MLPELVPSVTSEAIIFDPSIDIFQRAFRVRLVSILIRLSCEWVCEQPHSLGHRRHL
jgi:hypothetical protein